MKAKINLLRAILIILLIALFSTIFNFSGQDGEKSGSLSREITESVTKDIKKIQQLETNKKEEVLDAVEHFIRKLAHFSLYTLVGILAMSLMSTYHLKKIKKIDQHGRKQSDLRPFGCKISQPAYMEEIKEENSFKNKCKRLFTKD